MPFIATSIQGLWIFEPRLFEDERGYFFESYNHQQFVEATGFNGVFVQDNQSKSQYGVIRGLHCQLPPFAQAKLVRVLAGEIYDVAVDLRKNSPTYREHFGVILSAKNKKQLFVPHGFVHGFAVLSDYAEVMYKCDTYYAPQAESGVLFEDDTLQIDWRIPVEKQIISTKDQTLKPLKETNLML